MASPSASARRRTRWIQGTIIATSAVVIVWATVNIAGRGVQTTGQTTPVIITTTPVFEQSTAPAALPTTAEPPVQVVSPATVEAPPTTTAAAPSAVNYDNCAAVWAAIGAPIHRGEPGYSYELDRDRDGTGCENKP